MKREYELSPIIEKIFDLYVSDKDKRLVSQGTLKRISENGRDVRIQCFIPAKIYTILKAFGAFSNSESEFFAKRCESYIEERAHELKIMSSVLAAMAGGK